MAEDQSTKKLRAYKNVTLKSFRRDMQRYPEIRYIRGHLIL